jgi:hypothetical protein
MSEGTSPRDNLPPPAPKQGASLGYAGVPAASGRARRAWLPAWVVEPVSGYVTRRVACEKCGVAYQYELRRTARAHGWFFVPMLVLGHLLLSLCLLRVFLILRALYHLPDTVREARETAVGFALKRLRRKFLAEAEPVACPDCGWFQRDMVKEIRARTAPWAGWIAVCIVIGSLPVAWLLARRVAGADPDAVIRTWLIYGGIGMALGFGVLLVRWAAAAAIDPNAGDPTSRPTFPDAPPAVRAADHRAAIAAATARLTPSRKRPT